MKFNSYVFLFLFLPIALLIYYVLKRRNTRLSLLWLTAASLVFYGWSNPIYLALIAGSIVFNFGIGTILQKKHHALFILGLGIAINILFLGYFKYANFFLDTANALFGSNIPLQKLILPLAISFFTIQQIAYIVDAYRGELYKHSFIEYCTFVTFFPKLLSGPIVRFKEMMPEISAKNMFNMNIFAIGLTSLFLGLFKKVVLADQLGIYADPLFAAAANGADISFFNGWAGALAYTFQLYFDFSGYCDIAIGVGLMFNIRLPLNFYSPYKATSIIDFWRRWHMTLSRFIRDYLYIPFGGNRKGFLRQMVNLMVAMTIAGLWHGSGWTFVIWGLLHGLYLAVNHGWRQIRKILGRDTGKSTRWGTAISIFITFIAVVVAWVFFRADSVTSATEILKGMAGLNGFVLPDSYLSTLGAAGQFLNRIGVHFGAMEGFFGIRSFVWVFASLVICWFLPNVQEYLSNHQPSLDRFYVEPKPPRFSWLRWQPSFWQGLVIAIIAVITILQFTHVSNFIYSQF